MDDFETRFAEVVARAKADAWTQTQGGFYVAEYLSGNGLYPAGMLTYHAWNPAIELPMSFVTTRPIALLVYVGARWVRRDDLIPDAAKRGAE